MSDSWLSWRTASKNRRIAWCGEVWRGVETAAFSTARSLLVDYRDKIGRDSLRTAAILQLSLSLDR